MQKHKLLRYSLGLGLALALALSLLLWRLGLRPMVAYLLSMNAITFILYGHDKRQAVVGGTRIPEVGLHAAALLGGTAGAVLAQGLFRHKTRKRSFRVVFAAIILLQIIVGYGYWRFVHG